MAREHSKIGQAAVIETHESTLSWQAVLGVRLYLGWDWWGCHLLRIYCLCGLWYTQGKLLLKHKCGLGYPHRGNLQLAFNPHEQHKNDSRCL